MKLIHTKYWDSYKKLLCLVGHRLLKLGSTSWDWHKYDKNKQVLALIAHYIRTNNGPTKPIREQVEIFRSVFASRIKKGNSYQEYLEIKRQEAEEKRLKDEAYELQKEEENRKWRAKMDEDARLEYERSPEGRTKANPRLVIEAEARGNDGNGNCWKETRIYRNGSYTAKYSQSYKAGVGFQAAYSGNYWETIEIIKEVEIEEGEELEVLESI